MFGDFDEKLFSIPKVDEPIENKTFELESYAEYMSKGSQAKKKAKTKKPKEESSDLLKIIKFDTNKSKIKLRPLQEQKIIPAHPFRLLLVGRSGSGKSMNLCNLMTRPHMYGRTQPNNKKSQYFDDLIWLFSPTAECDDLANHLDLDEQKIITDEKLFTPVLEHILKVQKGIIDKKGLLDSPRICLVFDDIQSAEKFLKSPKFTATYIAGRHYNISTITCCQSWTRLPLMLYPSSGSEVELLADEYTPVNSTKKQFRDLIKYATKEPYSFLHINNQTKIKDRYRKCLDSVLTIE
jgi:hypothetical protein